MNKIICDQCNADLSKNSSHGKHYIEIVCKKRPNTDFKTYFPVIPPPFHDACHFCNLDCLTQWLKTLAEIPSNDAGVSAVDLFVSDKGLEAHVRKMTLANLNLKKDLDLREIIK